MCGIYFSLTCDAATHLDTKTLQNLKARGPDSLQTVERWIPRGDNAGICDAEASFHLVFVSSVLALRGDAIQVQPLVDEKTGSVLCWNGEAWKFDGDCIAGNDTQRLLHELTLAAANSSSPGIVDMLMKVTGPFAFVFYDATNLTVYYGRDRLGRRSLTQQEAGSSSVVLCSVSCDSFGEADEVSTTSVHALHLGDSAWVHTELPWTTPLPTINDCLPHDDLPPMPSTATIAALSHHLTASLSLRVTNIPRHEPQRTASNVNVAILFSGGLDCTLLARMIDALLPQEESIDLLNVAFENPRVLKSLQSDGLSPYEACPDRITGRSSFAELSAVCPKRTWRLVTIDIPYSEMLQHKPTIIDLMRPHNTEMDLSIAMALYFSARASGDAVVSTEPLVLHRSYTSPSRILISGLGADELFAGYSRHAASFARDGFRGLISELKLDFERIGSRNLGRDDRVISHWGKEVRYPYLDEDFILFVLSLPAWEKCGFRANRPIPKHYETTVRASTEEALDSAKMLLRLSAWKSGMKIVASERKRAIQFGARTAKMESGGRKKGTDVLN